MYKFASIVETKNHKYYICSSEDHSKILETFKNSGDIKFFESINYFEAHLRTCWSRIENTDLFPVWVSSIPNVKFYQEIPWRTVLQNNN